ncbi:MAG: hypothetical protein Q8N34_03220 [Gammaproteobacteria bacterium]|nr:hypothetical protein [Gammaproteobacteria bacterium]
MTLMVDLAGLVANALADAGMVTYTAAADIYPALIEADKAILLVRPDVNTETKIVECVAGTRQSIAAADLRLIDVKCNLHTDSTERSDVRRMKPQNLPRNWRTKTQVDEIEGYLFDDRDPKIFETFPPIKAGRKLRVVTSVPFAAYGTIGGSTESKLPQPYDVAKVEWALYRCFSRDNSPLASRAITHLQVFQSLLGIKEIRDAKASPKAGHQET